jgi:spore germination cell wall hydrolase CwlJ-like protein
MSILSGLSNFFQPHSFTYKAPPIGPTSPIAPKSLKEALPKNPPEKDIKLLAKIIFGEAAGEGKDNTEKARAMIAVANTIGNRSKISGKSLMQEATKRNQYSAYSQPAYWSSLDKKINEPIAKEVYNMAAKIAKDLITGILPDVTGGATFYYNPKKTKLTPMWAAKKQPNIVIGNHQFYKNIAPYSDSAP